MESEKLYPASGFDFDSRPVSYSTLKHILKSPLHFSYNWYNRKPPSDAMILGSIVDILLFNPFIDDEKIEDRIFIMPTINRRTNAGKEEYQNILDANEGKLLITKEQYDLATIMVESIKESPNTKWLYDSIVEVQKKIVVTMKVGESKTEIPVIMYLDAVSEVSGKRIVWDLKTANSADHDDFAKDAAKFDYPLQAAIYRYGYNRKTFSFPDFYYVVVEKNAPFAANSIKADNAFMELGKTMFDKCMKRVAFCKEHDLFDQGYEFLNVMGHDIMSVPYWYKQKNS